MTCMGKQFLSKFTDGSPAGQDGFVISIYQHLQLLTHEVGVLVLARAFIKVLRLKPKVLDHHSKLKMPLCKFLIIFADGIPAQD